MYKNDLIGLTIHPSGLFNKVQNSNRKTYCLCMTFELRDNVCAKVATVGCVDDITDWFYQAEV